MKDPDKAWEQYPQNLHDRMSPETKMALDALKEDLQEHKMSFSDLFSNFDGKVNMMVKLISDSQDKADRTYMRADIATEKLDNILGALNKNNNHLQQLNSKVAKHNEWINRYDESVKRLIEDRESKFKKYGDAVWKIAITIVMIVLGINLD